MAVQGPAEVVGVPPSTVSGEGIVLEQHSGGVAVELLAGMAQQPGSGLELDDADHQGLATSTVWRRAGARSCNIDWPLSEAPAQPLLLPCQWPIPEHLRQPQPLRLPPIEDRLHNVRHETGQRWEAPDEAALVTSSWAARCVIDLARPLSIRRRQRCARTTARTSVSSRRGFGVGTAAPLVS